MSTAQSVLKNIVNTKQEDIVSLCIEYWITAVIFKQ